MLYTSSYKKCLNCNKISISGDRGKSVDYQGECFSALAPKLSFWKIWHENIGKIPEEENNCYYIKKYYELVLRDLDPNEILNLLNNKILLCYEDNMEFCHRHIVAYWLELELRISVPEVEVDEYGNITIFDRPIWIKEILKKVIEETKKNQIKIFVKS